MNNRRDFLRLVGLGAAGAAMTVSVPATLAEAHEQRHFGGPGRGDSMYTPIRAAVSEPSRETLDSRVAAVKAAPATVYEQQFPVLTRIAGVGSSNWFSELRLEALDSNVVLDAQVIALPQNQDVLLEDGVSKNYYVAPGGAALITDPIGDLGLTDGNYTVIVRSTQPFTASGRFWNQRTDGQQLSNFHTGFTKEEVAQTGDLVAFSLPGEGMYTNLFGRMTSTEQDEFGNLLSPQFRVRVYNSDGGMDQDTGAVDAPNGGGFQYAKLERLTGPIPKGGRCELEVVRGEGIFLTSDVQDNGGENDGMANKGRLVPLFDGYAEITPHDAEVNDEVIVRIKGKTRPGFTVQGGSLEDYSTSTFIPGTDEDTIDYAGRLVSKQVGEFEPYLAMGFKAPNGGTAMRNIPLGTVNVVEAENELLSMSKIGATLEENLDLIANFLGENSWYRDGDDQTLWYHKDAATWKGAIQGQLGNISGITFMDQNNSIVFEDWLQTGNRFQTYIMGSERKMDEMYDLLTIGPE